MANGNNQMLDPYMQQAVAAGLGDQGLIGVPGIAAPILDNAYAQATDMVNQRRKVMGLPQLSPQEARAAAYVGARQPQQAGLAGVAPPQASMAQPPVATQPMAVTQPPVATQPMAVTQPPVAPQPMAATQPPSPDAVTPAAFPSQPPTMPTQPVVPPGMREIDPATIPKGATILDMPGTRTQKLPPEPAPVALAAMPRGSAQSYASSDMKKGFDIWKKFYDQSSKGQDVRPLLNSMSRLGLIDASQQQYLEGLTPDQAIAYSRKHNRTEKDVMNMWAKINKPGLYEQSSIEPFWKGYLGGFMNFGDLKQIGKTRGMDKRAVYNMMIDPKIKLDPQEALLRLGGDKGLSLETRNMIGNLPVEQQRTTLLRTLGPELNKQVTPSQIDNIFKQYPTQVANDILGLINIGIPYSKAVTGKGRIETLTPQSRRLLSDGVKKGRVTGAEGLKIISDAGLLTPTVLDTLSKATAEEQRQAAIKALADKPKDYKDDFLKYTEKHTPDSVVAFLDASAKAKSPAETSAAFQLLVPDPTKGRITEGTKRDANYIFEMKGGLNTVNELLNQGYDPTNVSQAAYTAAGQEFENMANGDPVKTYTWGKFSKILKDSGFTQEDVRYMQGVMGFIAPKTYLDSGKAITAKEWLMNYRRYMPGSGETLNTIKAKIAKMNDTANFKAVNNPLYRFQVTKFANSGTGGRYKDMLPWWLGDSSWGDTYSSAESERIANDPRLKRTGTGVVDATALPVPTDGVAPPPGQDGAPPYDIPVAPGQEPTAAQDVLPPGVMRSGNTFAQRLGSALPMMTPRIPEKIDVEGELTIDQRRSHLAELWGMTPTQMNTQLNDLVASVNASREARRKKNDPTVGPNLTPNELMVAITEEANPGAPGTLAGIGAGMKSVFDTLDWAVAKSAFKSDDPRALNYTRKALMERSRPYQLGREMSGVGDEMDWARVGGEVAATLPIPIGTTIPQAMASGFLAGALPMRDTAAEQVAYGGLGGVFGGLVQAGSKFFNRGIKPSQQRAAKEIEEELGETATAAEVGLIPSDPEILKRGSKLVNLEQMLMMMPFYGPGRQARKIKAVQASGKRYVDALREVHRDSWNQQVNQLQKVLDNMPTPTNVDQAKKYDNYANQLTSIVKAMENPTDDWLVALNQSVKGDILSKKIKAQSMYDTVANMASGFEIAAPTSSFYKTLQERVSKLNKAVNFNRNNKSFIRLQQLLDDGSKTAGGGYTSVVDPSGNKMLKIKKPSVPTKYDWQALDRVRQELGEMIGNETNAEVKAAMYALKDSIQDDFGTISNLAGKDVLQAHNAAKKYYLANVIPAKEKGLAKAFAKQDMKPDEIYKIFMKHKNELPSTRLYRYLGKRGRRIIQGHMIQDAFQKLSTFKAGALEPVSSPTALANKINNMLKNDSIFLDSASKKTLDRMARVYSAVGNVMNMMTAPQTGVTTTKFAIMMKSLTSLKGAMSAIFPAIYYTKTGRNLMWGFGTKTPQKEIVRKFAHYAYRAGNLSLDDLMNLTDDNNWRGTNAF